jgi:hypothetical protein
LCAPAVPVEVAASRVTTSGLAPSPSGLAPSLRERRQGKFRGRAGGLLRRQRARTSPQHTASARMRKSVVVAGLAAILFLELLRIRGEAPPVVVDDDPSAAGVLRAERRRDPAAYQQRVAGERFDRGCRRVPVYSPRLLPAVQQQQAQAGGCASDGAVHAVAFRRRLAARSATPQVLGRVLQLPTPGGEPPPPLHHRNVLVDPHKPHDALQVLGHGDVPRVRDRDRRDVDLPGRQHPRRIASRRCPAPRGPRRSTSGGRPWGCQEIPSRKSPPPRARRR